MTRGTPSSTVATTEFVVPRSIPTAGSDRSSEEAPAQPLEPLPRGGEPRLELERPLQRASRLSRAPCASSTSPSASWATPARGPARTAASASARASATSPAASAARAPDADRADVARIGLERRAVRCERRPHPPGVLRRRALFDEPCRALRAGPPSRVGSEARGLGMLRVDTSASSRSFEASPNRPSDIACFARATSSWARARPTIGFCRASRARRSPARRSSSIRRASSWARASGGAVSRAQAARRRSSASASFASVILRKTRSAIAIAPEPLPGEPVGVEPLHLLQIRRANGLDRGVPRRGRPPSAWTRGRARRRTGSPPPRGVEVDVVGVLVESSPAVL